MNGVLIQSKSFATAPPDSSTAVDIGTTRGSSYQNDSLDEVAIWNVSLSNETIQNHFQKGWGYFNTSNFTSQVFDANASVNWSYISWQMANDYQKEIGRGEGDGFSITDDSLVTVVEGVVVDRKILSQSTILAPSSASIHVLPFSSSENFSNHFRKEDSNLDIDGGWMRNTKIAGSFDGGNNEVFKKSLSSDNITLPSLHANEYSSEFLTPLGADLMSTPFFERDLTNLASTSSSARKLNFEVDKSLTGKSFSSVMQSGLDMLSSQRRESFKNVLDTFSSFEHFEDLPYHDSGAFEGGLSMADFAVCNNVLVDFGSHDINDDNVVFKAYGNNNQNTNSDYLIIPINEFKQICPTLDCNVVDYITAKKKIKDVIAGDYVQSFDENTGKIVARKVNALLDHGIKQVYELSTVSGRAINTTAEHPYLVKLSIKEECDKYAGTFWNKDIKFKDEFEQMGYCTRWVRADDLKKHMRIAVPRTADNYFDSEAESPVGLSSFTAPSSNSNNSLVVKTLTLDCCLNASSSDQIGKSNANANAKYGSSFVPSPCGEILLDSGRNFSYSLFLNSPRSLLSSDITSSNSSSLIFANFMMSDLLLDNSFDTKSGEANLHSCSSSLLNMSLLEELTLKNENSIEASTIKFSGILEGICSHKPCLLATLFFNSSPSLDANSSVISLFFNISSNLLNASSLLSLLRNASLATSDQLIQEYLFNSALTSFDMVNVTDAIHKSPLFFNSSNFLNSSSLLSMPCLMTSFQSTSGNLFLAFSKSSGNDTVIVVMFSPLLNSVNILKSVYIYKSFGFNYCTEGLFRPEISEQQAASFKTGESGYNGGDWRGNGGQYFDNNEVEFVEINNIKTLDKQHVFDLSIEGTRNFIANDIVAHNTAAKESAYINTTGLVLLMHLNNETGESERQLNETHTISNEGNLVLYMPFDSANARELVPNGSTVLLMHFNNDTGTGENASLFLSNATDSTGKGIGNGTCDLANSLCPVFNVSNARLGKAGAEFDGTNDFINGTGVILNGLSSASISAWFKTRTGQTNKELVGMPRNNAGGQGMDLRAIDADTIGGDVVTGGAGVVPQYDVNYADGNWHFISVTYDGSNARFYYDGVLQDTRAKTGTIQAETNGEFNIGAHDVDFGSYFAGTIDEVAIYNISLSSEIIAKHSGYGIDKSIYGNNATLINGSRINQTLCKFNECIGFDGTGDFVTSGTTSTYKFLHGALDTANFKFTIETWMKLNNPNPNANYGLVATATASSGVVGTTFMYEDRAAVRRRSLSLFIPNGNGGEWVCDNTACISNANAYPDDTNWHHVALVFDRSLSSGDAKFYVDGVFAGQGNEGPNEPSTADSTYNLHIGSFGSEANFFPGSLDEVAIWNQTLSPDKIAEHAGTKVLDYSQYLNNGTRVNQGNDFGRNFTDGKFSRALVFDGVDDRIKTNKTISQFFGYDNASIEAWIKPIGSVVSGGGTSYELPAVVGQDVSRQLGIHVGSISGNDYIWAFNWDGSEEKVGTPYNKNEWTHVVWVHSSGNLYLYKDGLLKGSTASGDTSDISYEVVIGREPTSTNGFNGTIDELSIWNVSLSADDIRKHYERGVLKLNLSYRTSADNITWNAWTGVSNNTLSVITGNAIGRYFQYKAAFNTTDARFTPVLNNVSINYSLRSNLTIWDDTDTLVRVVTQNVRFYANFTNGVNSINGTNINCSFSHNLSGSFSQETNMSFNSTTGIYFIDQQFSINKTAFFNVTCDATILGYNKVKLLDDFTIYPSLNITLNLNVSTVLNTGVPVAVSGHINLSNGTNVSNYIFNIYVNDLIPTITSVSSTLGADNFTDTSQNDFTAGVNNLTNATASPGNVTLANDTSSSVTKYFSRGNFTSRIFNATAIANWTNISFATDVPYQRDLEDLKNASTVLLMHFNNGTGENDSLFLDSSQYLNNGTCDLANSKCPIYNSSSKFGKYALTFDGVNDYIDTGTAKTWGIANYLTVSAWIYAYQTYTATDSGAIWSIGNGYNKAGSLYFRGTGELGLIFYNNPEGDAFRRATGVPIQLNAWNHVTGVVNNNEMYVYLNGVDVTSARDGGGVSLTDVSRTMYISAWLTGTTNFFNGTIDEVAVWNMTLENETIKQHVLRGHANLSLQARTCTNSDCSDNPSFVGPSGAGSYFTNISAVGYPNLIGRYFQYRAYLSTNSTNLTPMLQEVNVSYKNVTTDIFGNYNVTITANSLVGTYTVKVNTTYAGGDVNISGEQTAILSVRNAQTISLAAGGAFIVQDSTGASLAIFDSNGNVNILGNLSQNSELYAGPKDFAVQNSTGGLNLVITNPEGNMSIKNLLAQNQASPLSPTPSSFVIQNSTGRTVAYVNSTGGLFITGTLTEKVLFG